MPDVESATIDIHTAPRNTNLRAYLAGGGATAALVAAAVVVFLGVAAFVGFNGLPFGADDSPEAAVNLAAGVPAAAATAAAPTADAVAADPATPSAAAVAEILAALPPGAVPNIPGITSSTPGFDGGGSNLPGGETPIPGTPAPGTLGNAVAGLEDTAGNLGLDLPLGDLTDGLTGPLDKTVKDTVNGVGGAARRPEAGRQGHGLAQRDHQRPPRPRRPDRLAARQVDAWA